MVPDTPPPPPAPGVPPVAALAHQAASAGVAAVVNGKKILRSQVASEALKIAGPQIVNQMILIELVNQEAAKQHVVVTPAQVGAKLAELRGRYAQAPGGLDAMLAQRGESLATYMEQLGVELKVEALVAKTLKSTPGPLKYHARHLLIATVPVGPAMAPGAKPPHTDAEALALIAKAQVELKAGANFVDVATKYTEDPAGKTNGGNLGIIDASTQFDPNFLKAALALKPGEVTPTPVKSSYGYHLIKIDSTSAAPTPADKKLYDDAATASRAQQIQQAVQPYVLSLRSRAKIVNYLGPTPTFAPAQRVPSMPMPRSAP